MGPEAFPKLFVTTSRISIHCIARPAITVQEHATLELFLLNSDGQHGKLSVLHFELRYSCALRVCASLCSLLLGIVTWTTRDSMHFPAFRTSISLRRNAVKLALLQFRRNI
jgi:hypothetical protein